MAENEPVEPEEEFGAPVEDAEIEVDPDDDSWGFDGEEAGA